MTLTAQFFHPATAAGRLPAVIMVPGSGGIGPHHLRQSAALTNAGFAVLLIDPFHGRGIRDTVADQARLSWAAGAFDVIAAFQYLRSRDDIDVDRIGAVGSSRGGSAVLFALSEHLSRYFPSHAGLKAAVTGYPWCGSQFYAPRLANNAALLVLSGDRDDWVSVQQCQDAVHALAAGGNNASMRIFPGARHAFDRDGVAPLRIEDAVTSTTFPTVYMDDAGNYYDPATGQPNPTLTSADFVRRSIEDGFVRRGVTIGTEGDQADRYVRAMVDFLSRHLGILPEAKVSTSDSTQ
ncbi:dienelactone hydrolase family protein [Sphingopyxis sp. NJF-3]